MKKRLIVVCVCFLSVFIATSVISLGEYLMTYLFPLPVGTNMKDPKAVVAAMSHLPHLAYVVLLVNYMFAAFLGGVAGTLMLKRSSSTPALVVGIFLTAAGIVNNINMPHPLWFSIVNVVVFLPFAYLGYHILKLKQATADVEKI